MANSGSIQSGLIPTLAVVALLSMAGASADQLSDCMPSMVSLTPCIGYISGSDATPPAQCCQQLASVVQSQPLCLCFVLQGGAASLGIDVNTTLALALPGTCNVQTPPVSECNASSAAPAISPSGSGSSSSSAGSGSSAGSDVQVPISLISLVVLITAYVFTSSSTTI